MGSLFSLCCSSASDTPANDDHEPLLGNKHERLPPPETPLDKLADVFAALNTGKLPSQEQINVGLRKLLKSSLFDLETRGKGYGPLSKSGKEVVGDLRELVEAILQFGMEKNDDDIIQDLVYQVRTIGDDLVTVDVNTDKNPEAVEDVENIRKAIPSSDELARDARRFTNSILTIARLIFTSQNLRYLISDVIVTFRSLISDLAGDVAAVAHTVEIKAEEVQDVARPDGDHAKAAMDMDWKAEAKYIGRNAKNEIGKDAKADWKNLKGEAPERTRKAAVDRILKIINDAQSSPYYSSSLRTLFSLARSYTERLDSVATATLNLSSEASSSKVVPLSINTDSHLSQAFEDLRILLERLAAGYGLSRFISQLQKTYEEINNAVASSPEFKHELHDYLRDLDQTLEKALDEPAFATSPGGRETIEDLYDRGRNLMQSNGPWVQEANKVLDEVDVFIQCLHTDRTTQRIIHAFDKLSTHFADLFKKTIGAAIGKQRALQQELKADLLGWMMPRVLRLLKTLPIPRVEVKANDVEVVLEGMVWEAGASFVPDHVVIQNWSEIRLDASAATPDPALTLSISDSSPAVQTATRTNIHMDGLRIYAHDIGYYMRYFGMCGLGWEDAGFVSVEVGRPDQPGEGLSVTIDIETQAQTDETVISNSVFQISDVKVSIPGLCFSIDQSRHWILNKLLVQPLSGPSVRYILSSVLETQIHSVLERFNRLIVEIKREARARVKLHPKRHPDNLPTWDDYWTALCFVMGSRVFATEEQSVALDYSDTVVESTTQVTVQGIIHETQTYDPALLGPRDDEPSETLVAVGIGPQILRDKNPPQKDTVQAVAEETMGVVEDLQDAAGKAKDASWEAVDQSAKVKESVVSANEREERREGVEKRRTGWKSKAFDF